MLIDHPHQQVTYSMLQQDEIWYLHPYMMIEVPYYVFKDFQWLPKCLPLTLYPYRHLKHLL